MSDACPSRWTCWSAWCGVGDAGAGPAGGGQGRSAVLLLLAGLVLVGLNLRLTLSVVTPLLPQVRTELGIDSAVAGGLASSAVVLFGVFALLAPRIARGIGLKASVLLGLLAVIVGSSIRAGGDLALLYLGMILIGAGIGVMNVVLPALVKLAFPQRMALGTAVYTSALNIGSAVAAVGAVPLARLGGWELALLASGVPAVIATAAWLLAPMPREHGAAVPVPIRRLLCSRVAWYVTAYMSIQSVLYYVLLVWLPTVFVDAGMDAVAAGGYLSLAQLLQLSACLLVPLLARRSRSTVLLGVAAAVPIGVAYAGIAFAPLAAPALWTALLGIGQGAALTVALILIADRGATPSVSLALSGLSQCVGYFAAAAAPVLVGAVHDATGSWTAALAPLTVLSAVLGFVAWRLRGGARVGTG